MEVELLELGEPGQQSVTLMTDEMRCREADRVKQVANQAFRE